MSSYGWTLDQALDLTYPQIKALYRTLMKWPTANMFVAMMSQHLNEGKDETGKLESMKSGSVSVVDGADFFSKLGIKPEPEG
ncbi:MAG: hypothetical protein KGZ65_04345 [Sphingomonadales bacterium]|nr:hypothetical protein [Sphingomonadaceae bacterium]MBS3930444.1 hypothetical protein [Sphingomonadales bacterium]